jgi:type II secretory pathway pseudopilin PulG
MTMRLYKKCRKGLTILELVIAMGIAASLLVVTFSFFLPQQKALKDTTNRSQLQMDTQLILDSISSSVMEASKIEAITSKKEGEVTSNLAILGGLIDIRSISFLVNNTDANGDNTVSYKYSYSIGTGDQEGKLYLTTTGFVTAGKGTDVNNKLIGENIQSIKVEPMGGAFFANCSGIKITLEVNIKDSDKKNYVTESKIYFRNR